MQERYKAKHYREEVKINSICKMIISVILLIWIALNNMSGILSYFTSRAFLTNLFSLASTYTVHYDANGGTGTQMADQIITIGSSANLTTNTYTNAGLTFAGWNTDANGNGTSYSDGQSVTNLTSTPGATVTLYAQWSTGTYNITYNLDDGTVATPNPTTYTANTSTFTLNNPTKTGYTFTGWSGTGLTGDDNLTVTITQGSTGNRTYTAHFEPITYYIRFNANGGSGTMANQELTYGTSDTLTPNEFEYPEYYFTEWTTEQGGTGTHYNDEDPVINLTTTDGDIIDLYAQWAVETNVAQIVGGQKYSTLQAAITAAKNLGGHQTVKLLKNIELTSAVTVASGSDITLDLRNFTLKNRQGSGINIIKNSGTLEIVGGANGTITSDAGYGAIDNDYNGNLTVSSGNIIATGSRQAIYNAGGIVEVKGTAYLSSSASDRPTIQNYKPNGRNAGTITISGGTIISTTTTSKGAIENENTGTVIITGGEIISQKKVGVNNAGTLIIGTKDGDVNDNSPVIQGATYGVNSTTTTLEFYDGIVKGKTHAFNNENNITEIEDNCDIDHGSELIDGYTYETAYLDPGDVRLIFDGNGGTPIETIVFVPENTAIGANMPANPTRPRHHFDGWFTDPTNGTQITSSTVVSANDTYYAHWTKTQALVQFDAGNDGTSSEASREVNIGSTIGTLPTATKLYNTFVGWFTSDSGGTQITPSQQINDDITYYAHWDPIIATVTLDPNNGTIPTTTGWTINQQTGTASKTVVAGNTVGTLPVPTRANWDFVGWYTDPNNGTRISESEVIQNTVTYYAHWTDNSVAAIGQNKYASLQDAINDVPANNTQTTITLLKDDLEAVSILDTNKNIILDLNGHTLYNDGSKRTQSMNDNSNRKSVIENIGTLKIMNGTITNSDNSGSANQAALNTGTGTVILENATVTHTGTANNATKQAIYVYSGTLLITGNSTISANNTGAYGGFNRGAIQNAGTVIVKGGTVTSTRGPAIVTQTSATLELGEEDGTIGNTTPVIQGKTNGVEIDSSATFNFYDGIVKGVTASISGTVSDTETGASRVDDTETIGSDTYHTTYYQ